MTITLTGPLMPQVVPAAVELLRSVRTGRWGAVADVVADQLLDPDAAARELDSMAPARSPRPGWPPVVVDGDSATFDGPRGVLPDALDLYTRILLGQFGELAWAADHGGRANACNEVRVRYQKPNAWPELAAGSWSIAGNRAPAQAKAAYQALTVLRAGSTASDQARSGTITVAVS